MSRPVLFSVDLVRSLGWMDRVDPFRAYSDGTVVIDVDEHDFYRAEPSVTRIEWGEPDRRGYYTPTIYREYPA